METKRHAICEDVGASPHLFYGRPVHLAGQRVYKDLDDLLTGVVED